MKKIRVLQHVHCMNRAGAETLLMNLYRNIDREKFEFNFISHIEEKADFDDEIKALGGKIIHIPSVDKIGIKKFKKNLVEAINKNGPYDVFHTHVQYFSGISQKVAKECGIPIRVAHSHLNSDYKEGSFIRKLYRNYMKRLINKNSTVRLACSKSAGKMLFDENDFELFSNAIDLGKFKYDVKSNYIQKEINELDGCKVICHIGRFVDAKNHDFLFEVFNEISKADENFRLLLLGDGPRKQYFEKLAKNMGIDSKVFFLGVRPDVPEILSSVDIILFPSHIEGLPVVLVEAQAAGVPCVLSSNIPNEVDMRIGIVEFLDLNDSIEKWKDTTIKMAKVEKKSFDERREKLITNGYDLEDNIRKLKKIYTNEE